MPLAFPLVVVLAVLLAGCAQSSRSFGWLSFLGGEADSAQPATPRTLAKIDRTLDVEETSRQAAADTATAPCTERRVRGIAEVVRIMQDQVLLRFYPGDEVFLRDRHDQALLGARVGDELRTLRAEPVAGHCQTARYELLSEGFIPEDQGLAWAPGA